MNCKYLQLSRCVFQSIFHSNQIKTLDNYLAKRWAGHAKWQNVKADKEQSNKFKNMHFSKLTKDISLAVKEDGENPATNPKLRNLIEAARKVSMPNTTIQKAIDRGKSKTGGKPYWVACKGPFNIQVGFEVTFPQQLHFQTECGTRLKKIGLKVEKNVNNTFTERGVIVCEPLKDVDNSFDTALEVGIEIGANDVFETESKTLLFECPPERVDSIEAQLSKKGYKIQSSGTEIEFHEVVELKEEDLQKIRTALDKIVESHDEVQRCSHNIVYK